MAYLTGSAKRHLAMFAGINDKEQYTVSLHTGEETRMTGKELRLYIAAHSRFIHFEQPVSDRVIANIENYN